MSTDKFSRHERRLDSPGFDAEEVNPGVQEELTVPSRGIYVGGTGDLEVQMYSGNQVSFLGIQGGTLLPIRVKKVLSSGTTATGIVSLF